MDGKGKGNRLKLSYIVPVYNTELYLEECIESLYHQGFRNEEFEVIAINDGSTDKSADILKKLGENHANITIISQINRGLSSTRNLGIDNAQGEYVLFVDSDDIIVPNTMKYLVELANAKSPDIVRGNYAKFYTELEKEQLLTKEYNQPEFIEANGKTCFLKFYDSNVCYSCFNLYKKDFLIRERLYFPEGIYFEDMVHTTKAYILAQSLIKINLTFYLYRQHPASILATINERKLLDLVKVAVMLEQHTSLLSDDKSGHMVLKNAIFNILNKVFCYLIYDNDLYPLRFSIIPSIQNAVPTFWFCGSIKQTIVSWCFTKFPYTYITMSHIIRREEYKLRRFKNIFKHKQ